ncbi:hypothetical protein KR018_006651 [Drosophila ironensis]|nr:hypothetical protein KR018_006651 [Drosophila ironensis]
MLSVKGEKKPKRVRGNYKNVTWKRLGFVSADQEDGDAKKYRALCLHCNKCQSNTSIDRLIIHRKSCPIYKADLTDELGSPVLKKEISSTETNTSPESAPITETIELPSVNLLDKLLVEDDNDRNGGSTLVGYLNELDQLVALPPSDANRLQKDLIKAETEYLEAKAAYFTKMNEISELTRSVTMLEAKKTQLEIAKLKAECE